MQDGTATRQDRDGNHNSDVNADKGVEVIHSPGLVKLAHWAANRHQAYKRLMMRVQKIIIGMTIHEKELRAKQHSIDKAVLGYDPEKWVLSDACIRHEDQDTTD